MYFWRKGMVKMVDEDKERDMGYNINWIYHNNFKKF